MSNIRTPQDSGHVPDGPKGTLRIVDVAHRRALLEELGPELRELYGAVLAGTLADGVPVSPTAVAVVLSAHDEHGIDPRLFTGAHVAELLWFAIADFCREYGLEVPAGCREALHAIIAIGYATGRLHDESDELGSLFAAFHELVAS